MKKMKLFLLTITMICCMGVVSYAQIQAITAENDIEMTTNKHYPIINITNHKDQDITVEWGAYGDVYQGDILVPANSTKILELKELSFLGDNKETTRVWLTWSEENVLKPRGTDIVTIPFESTKPNNPPEELGMK